MKRQILTALSSIAISTSLAQASEAPRFQLPTHSEREAIFDQLVSEMTRLDGEALTVRLNRPKSWTLTLDSLKGELSNADDAYSFYRVFLKVDAAYPNLHAYGFPGKELMRELSGRVRPLIRFDAEWLSPKQTRFVISKIEETKSIPVADRPELGDEVVAVNGRSMKQWSDENFLFCKWPIQEQCDVVLDDNLSHELLSWGRAQPLTYTLKRADRVWTITVSISEIPLIPSKDPLALDCTQEPDRYPGFRMVYSGNRACVFESDQHPGTAILRITSFQYRLLTEKQPIRSLDQEVRQLYPWWKDRANWSHLVIDLIDNGGGNAPIGYYQLLFQKEFQEQYVQFRKGPEMADPKIRKGIFWEEKEKEIWFQNLMIGGIWNSIRDGEFLPQVPMFCAEDDRSCSEGMFHPRKHPFRGRVSVLLNQFCVSSCDAFSYSIHEQFGSEARFFGHPQAADTAYSRLAIDVVHDPATPARFRTVVRPFQDDPSDRTLLTQLVGFSRSVTLSGEPVAGKGVPIHQFVPMRLENVRSWHRAVLETALNNGLSLQKQASLDFRTTPL